MSYTVAFKTLVSPNKTKVGIKQESPYRYFEEELTGDRTGEDEQTLIEAVLDNLRAELDPTSTIVKLQNQQKEMIEALKKSNEAVEKSNKLSADLQLAMLANAEQIEEIAERVEILEEHAGFNKEDKTVETEEQHETTEHSEEHISKMDGGNQHE